MTNHSAPRYDWQAIRQDFEGTPLSLSEISRRHGPTASRICDEARSKGWVRFRKPDDFDSQVHRAASETSSYLPKELTDHAVLTAAEMIGVHRKDAAKLRTISNTLVERLGMIVEGNLTNEQMQDMICLGARESPADLLEKLSRVLVRMTELERQAYGLDTFDPETTAKEEEVSRTVDELWDRVYELQSDKSAKR